MSAVTVSNPKSSVYRGVYKRKKGKPYEAGVTIDGKYVYLGTFEAEIEAARAVDKKLSELGRTEKLNFPLPKPSFLSRVISKIKKLLPERLYVVQWNNAGQWEDSKWTDPDGHFATPVNKAEADAFLAVARRSFPRQTYRLRTTDGFAKQEAAR